MKGVQVQLTSFMSSVYITEDRIIEKGIVQVGSLVCLGPKELFSCNWFLYYGGAVVDWCLNYGGVSMERLYLTVQSNLYFQQPLVNTTSHKQPAIINNCTLFRFHSV